MPQPMFSATATAPISARPRKPGDWVVRMNHRNRSWSFALLFAALGSHLASQSTGPLAWCLLGFQFLVYPQLLYWLARRSSNPARTELNNMGLDTLLFGAWAAALSFPLWISFILFLGASVNLTAFHGWKGLLRAVVLMLAGAAPTGWLNGFQVSLNTGWPATLLSIICVTLFMIVVAEGAYSRAIKLYDTREQLRQSEQALKAANSALEQRLEENLVLQKQLTEQAQRDPLTGLYNRRFLDTSLAREISRSLRQGEILSLMLIDLDFFKKINDSYGHQIGDEILKNLARLLNHDVRSSDIACRFGGEEFLVLMPNMGSDIARQRAEQWRRNFAETAVVFDEQKVRATLSIGIASFPEDGMTAQDLIHSADAALYQAKAQGRNRVVQYRVNHDWLEHPDPALES